MSASLILSPPLALRAGAQTPAPDSGDVDLAKKLSNPVASLISVPVQYNFDENFGRDEGGERSLTNVQPVVPVSLSQEWNLISRTILPIIHQRDMPIDGMDERGVGDVVQSFFFSPAKPTRGGLIWGVGPVFGIPTASDDVLGNEQWNAGPTGVFLEQEGPWTYGALVNHLWSMGGDDDREDVNATFLQPFLAYTTHTATTFTLNMETTRDWETDEWLAPVNLMASQLFKLGGQPMSVGAGLRYWIDSPSDSGPEGLGFRLVFTLLFPK